MDSAGVAEWQTRRTQNPLVARPCGFDSLLRHHPERLIFLYIRRTAFPRVSCVWFVSLDAIGASSKVSLMYLRIF